MDQDSFGSLDPDPNKGRKNDPQKLRNFMFGSAGCLLEASPVA